MACYTIIRLRYQEAVMEGLKVVIMELQSAGEEEDKEAEEDDAASVGSVSILVATEVMHACFALLHLFTTLFLI